MPGKGIRPLGSAPEIGVQELSLVDHDLARLDAVMSCRDRIHDAIDDRVPVVLVEAQRGHQVDAILGVASGARVGVGAAEHHL